MNNTGSSKPRQLDAQGLFDSIDINGDGVIDREEWARQEGTLTGANYVKRPPSK